jgi:ribonuclease HII
MSLMDFEINIYKNQNHRFIGGIDEVGRGCLAGPLVTAIVVYDIENLIELAKNPGLLKKINQIKDSKKLSEKKREELSAFIKEIAFFYAVDEVSNHDIDNKGISQVTNNSFFKNYSYAYAKRIDFVLIDAFRIKEVEPHKQSSLVKGDNTSLAIASASIIAKYFRDELMKKIGEQEEFKVYGFDSHKGYGTAAHIETIKRCGVSTIHRKSFEPIKSMIK